LLAEAIGFLVIVGNPEFQRVGAVDVAEIILVGSTRLLGAVIGGPAPAGELRERNIAKIDIAIDGVDDADLTLPVLPYVDREGVFVKGIDAEGEVIEHARRDGPVVSDPVQVGGKARLRETVEGNREAGRSRRSGLQQIA